MAYGLPALVEGAEGLGVSSLVFRHDICLDLFDELLLGLQVSVEIVLGLGVLVPLGEELVAGGTETLPNLLALLAGHGTYFLPLLLKLDELIGSFLPFSTVLEGLSLFDDGHLLVKIGVHRVFELVVVVTLVTVERITGCTEAVVDLLVFLAGGKTDLTPFFLEFLDFA